MNFRRMALLMVGCLVTAPAWTKDGLDLSAGPHLSRVQPLSHGFRTLDHPFASFELTPRRQKTSAANLPHSNAPGSPRIRAKFGWESATDVEYATFRSGGSVYFKGKAGYLWREDAEDLEEVTLSEIVDNLDSRGAVGLGAGYNLNNGDRLEFEYTIDQRNQKFFNIGYTF